MASTTTAFASRAAVNAPSRMTGVALGNAVDAGSVDATEILVSGMELGGIVVGANGKVAAVTDGVGDPPPEAEPEVLGGVEPVVIDVVVVVVPRVLVVDAGTGVT